MDAVVYAKIGQESEKLSKILLGMYPQEAVENASVASVPDGADDIPVKNLTIGIKPVQDLHGYANPWPGGGSVNMLNPETIKPDSTKAMATINPDGSWTIRTGNSAVTQILAFGSLLDAGETYTVSFPDGAATIYVQFSAEDYSHQISVGGHYTFTWNDGDSYCRILTDNVPANTSRTFKIQLEKGSSATSFVPYSNICPISGWTGANVTRTGKNLYNPDESENNTFLDYSTISDRYGQAITASGYWTSGFIPVKAGATYYRTPVGTGSSRACFYNSSKTCIGHQAYSGGSITIPNGASYIRFCGATTTVAYNGEIQFELGSSASNYQPYQTIREVSISFPSEAGTVYGGTLDVTSGLLTVTMGYADLGALTWVKTSSSVGNDRRFSSFSKTSSIKVPSTTGIKPNILCSYYKTITANAAWMESSNGITVNNDASITIFDAEKIGLSTSEFKTAMSGVQLAYELAVPITYQLTPTEVRTLLGVNNIWADTGDVAKLIYRADPGAYFTRNSIENYTKFAGIISGVESGMTASKSYTAGQYFIVGQKLYKATTNIASGAAFTVGTNCQETTVGAELTILNA